MDYPNESEGRIRLTPTELRVLRNAADGSTSASIAVAMNLSKRTVDFHLGNIYTKMGVSNRLQATNKARSMGLLS
jgi:DNA-binding NarL/FixJ family response regulator